MSALVKQSEEFLVATAFVSAGAVQDFLVTAAEHGPRIRFLTGTFGHNTRQATFARVLKLQQQDKLEARLWRCSAHENFHEKLYLWRLSNGRGVAWVGSANFTDGGMQAEGEFVLEVRGRWDGADLRALRANFEAEWRRGQPISDDFVDGYKEAARPAVDLKRPGKRRGAAKGKVVPSKGRVFITRIEGVVDDVTEERVQRLLGGTADDWVRHRLKSLSKLRRGQRGILVDNVDGKVALVEVTDTAQDRRFGVFAYEPVFGSRSWLKWSSPVRRSLAAAGVGSEKKRPRTRWVSPAVGAALVKAMYPRRTQDW